MASLPTDDEVRAELGLGPGAHLAHDVRTRTVKVILDRRVSEAAAAERRAAEPAGQLLSRNTFPHPDGTLVVSVVLIPKHKETPQ